MFFSIYKFDLCCGWFEYGFCRSKSVYDFCRGSNCFLLPSLEAAWSSTFVVVSNLKFLAL